MSAKYDIGQRVKILSIPDSLPKSAYPELEARVSETAVVVDYYNMSMTDPSSPRPDVLHEVYLYKIRFDTDDSVLDGIPESVLTAID